MMEITQHGGCQEKTRVVDLYNAAGRLGAPFTVNLHNSVEITSDSSGEFAEYFIPNLDGLCRVVAQSRVLHARRLCGADIKFLRKCLGVKAKDLAKAIDFTPEHLSKCENGIHPISLASEKLLRMFMFKTSLQLSHNSKSASKVQDALDTIFDLVKPVGVFKCDEEIILDFELRRVEDQPSANDDSREWEEPGSKRVA